MSDKRGIFFAVLSMQLLLSVGLAAIAALGTLVASFFGLGGWGLALAIWFWLTAATGWRLLSSGAGTEGIKHNGEGAYALVVFICLIAGGCLVIAPPKITSWWAVLMPLTIVPATVLLWVLEKMLDTAHPEGRR